MSISVLDEPPIPLADVPRLAWIPRRRLGRKLHKSTVYRWATSGLHGVRLEAIRIGGALCTTEQALQRFFLALTSGKNQERPGVPDPMRAEAAASQCSRRQTDAMAEAELRRLGL